MPCGHLRLAGVSFGVVRLHLPRLVQFTFVRAVNSHLTCQMSEVIALFTARLARVGLSNNAPPQSSFTRTRQIYDSLSLSSFVRRLVLSSNLRPLTSRSPRNKMSSRSNTPGTISLVYPRPLTLIASFVTPPIGFVRGPSAVTVTLLSFSQFVNPNLPGSHHGHSGTV